MNSLGLSPWAAPIAASGLLLMSLQSTSLRRPLARLSRWAPAFLDATLGSALVALLAAELLRSPYSAALASAAAAVLLANAAFAASIVAASPVAAGAPGLAVMALGAWLVVLGWPKQQISGVSWPENVEPGLGGRECICGCGRRLPDDASRRRKYFDAECRRSASRLRRRAKTGRRHDEIAA